MVSGSDRFCDRWHQGYAINGVDGIALQHLYRARGFLGEELAGQMPATAFAPRCTEDRIEEEIFFHRRDDKGQPICCEMWPGNTADVKSLLPVVESIRKRFGIRSFCIVADRGWAFWGTRGMSALRRMILRERSAASTMRSSVP